ncbi:ABC transporter G family member 23-like [Ischnura elegans]|uniref:ABC transporter G family member 23-like n=1 Tax=Ischnura elegans TaxID=197161 RepID=UPI001ED866A8|nr:ABC transporter G family member 23-like [Ischnura elegans]
MMELQNASERPQGGRRSISEGPPSPAPADTEEGTSGTVEAAVLPKRPPFKTQVSTVWSRKQNAVSVRRACKMYGPKKNRNPVLDQLNMTVPKGTIYGLLGASGCGKTTLLTCIVGRRRLNTGEIWVLGGKPGSEGSGVPGKRVGYMPQETALYSEFTIRETMLYFGWIFGMSTNAIDERLSFLTKLLELPPAHRQVKTLSGGQQRRVSLSAAFLHEPELLILDEPTVGVDPLLRQSIWKHLITITKEGNTTVIITTHYIEEARDAHKIGLMRGGKLLAEESPDNLLAIHHCGSLEEVFLKLCVLQNRRKRSNVLSGGSDREIDMGSFEAATQNAIELDKVESDSGLDEEEREEPSALPEIKPRSREPSIGAISADLSPPVAVANDYDERKIKKKMSLGSSRRIGVLVWKNFMWMLRNYPILLTTVGMPLIQTALFCMAVGHDPRGLKIAVVNHELGPLGPLHDFTSRSDECIPAHGCNLTSLSCRYLQHLQNRSLITERFDDTDSALEAIRRGNVWGAIYFTENYTDAVIARVGLGRDADEETLDQSEMRVWLDMSNQHIGLMIQRDLQQSYFSFARDITSSCNYDVKLAEIPVRFNDPVYGPRKPNFTDFSAPGVILTIVFFLSVALTSGAMIIERKEGLIERSLVSGITPLEILMSHVVTQFVVMTVQVIVVLVLSFPVFGISIEGDMVYVVILTVLNGLCGMCFGFLISCACDDERSATYLGLGSFLPVIMLCGIIWPVEGIHYSLKSLSVVMPLTQATASMRSILGRGWGIDEPVVYLGFISTFAWIAVFLTGSFLMLKFKKG